MKRGRPLFRPKRLYWALWCARFFAVKPIFRIFAEANCFAKMLERDYIMRLVREFFEALELLKRKDLKERRDELERMYGQYAGPYAFYRTASVDEIMDAMQRYSPAERLPRLEMLAELYYAETALVSAPERVLLLEKAFSLFNFVDSHDRTYDMVRLSKMAEIRKRIDSAGKAAGTTS